MNGVLKSDVGSRDHRRALGSYYSPEPLARVLVRWALRGQPGRLLDPSYGGCAFLRVAVDELTLLTTPEQARASVFGADIDSSTASWAAHLVSQGVPTVNLRSADFLSLQPGRELPRVDAVVGNPPYIRHHWLTAATKQRITTIAESAGVDLSGRSSMWAAFVIHACSFIEPGGRLAFVLPGSVLYADYARAVRNYLGLCFERVQLIRLAERLFDDASEETVVLIAEGARTPDVHSTPSRVVTRSVCGLEDLARLLEDRSEPVAPVGRSDLAMIPAWKLQHLSDHVQDVLARFLAFPSVEPLSAVAKVSLGCVTGANHFFVLDDEQVRHLQTEESVVPTIARTAWLTRPTLTMDDFLEASCGSPRYLLALGAQRRIDGRTTLARYLRLGVTQGIPERHHCQRDPWWSIEVDNLPDAFMPYTLGKWRGLALNEAAVTSTNTVHQVRWLKETTRPEALSRALVSWSSVAQLWAELIGRRLGGGVLKLELGDASRMPTMSDVVVSDDVVKRLVHGNVSVGAIADEALSRSDFRLTPDELESVRGAISGLAGGRVPGPHVAADRGEIGPSMGSSAVGRQRRKKSSGSG